MPQDPLRFALPQPRFAGVPVRETAPCPGQNHIRGLYLHVPFCRHKCHYCDFYSFVDTEGRQSAFVDRACVDIEASRPWMTAPLETIFVGGGTPTLLEVPLLKTLMGRLSTLPRTSDLEWTVEANPETVTREVADALVESGVNRVSLGVQSFDRGLLRQLEREHDPSSVARAMGFLRSAGISKINLDLIFGIPTATLEQWKFDLDASLALDPDHFSCYALAYEQGTPLEAKLKMGRIARMDDELEAQMYEWTRDRLGAAGYTQYEVSNWARTGQECQHNLLYWEMANWWGIGPSATAQVGGVRWKIVPRLGDWLAGPVLGDATEIERSDPDTAAAESFMMGLRLIAGMARDSVERLLSHGDFGQTRARVIQAAIQSGAMHWKNDRLAFTESGIMTANSWLVELLPPSGRIGETAARGCR